MRESRWRCRCRGRGLYGSCRRIVVLLTVLLTVPSGMAFGQVSESEKRIRVIQQKQVVRYHRFRLTPFFLVGINELLTRHIGVGGQASFSITEDWAVGVEYAKFFAQKTALSSSIIDEYRVASEYRPLNHLFGATGSYIPVSGKFLFFGLGPIWWDLRVLAGMGAMRTAATKYHVSGTIGAAFEFVLWRFLGLRLAVRDYMYYEDYRISGKFRNSVFVLAGLSVLVPFRYEYRFPK